MLRIAILNSMPESALRSTELQFNELLSEAALDIPIEITWFSFLHDRYRPSEELWALDHVDGLIVTGTEPRAHRFSDEPYWPDFARTVDWAATHTTSAVWSCLGAHAAAFYLDGITRQRFATKLHGVFDTVTDDEHSLLYNIDSTWRMPHSRWNTLPVHVLHAKGYRILAHGAEVGADVFIKTCGNSLFVFLQGHPEYHARALMLEYRRDVLRYHTKERGDYPAMPSQYFDLLAARHLRELEVRALANRNPDLSMVAFQGIVRKANLEATWKADAVQLYRNWFGILLAERAKKSLVAA